MNQSVSKPHRDRLLIQATAWDSGPLSRVDLHHSTRLRPSTISLIVRRLLDEGKLLEAGRGDNPKGRKQNLLRLNEEFGSILALEFDDEKITASIIDLYMQIKASITQQTILDQGMPGLTQQLLSCAHKAIEQAEIPTRNLIGIGVADPGLVNTHEGVTVTSSTIEFWRHVSVKQIFEKEFAVPTLVESKTRAKAVAERVLRAGRIVGDMIYIDYGAGIGAAMILGGRLVHGHRWAAGEVGHIQMIENGPACKCGNFGCLEAIAGTAALESRMRKALAEGSGSKALELVGGDTSKLTGWTVLRASRLGDKTSSAIVEQAVKYLGFGLAILVNLFNPSLVILDQRLEIAGPDFLDQIMRIVKQQAIAYSTEDLILEFARMPEAGVLGMGLMVLQSYFGVHTLKPPKFLVESRAKSKQRSGVEQEALPDLTSSNSSTEKPEGLVRT